MGIKESNITKRIMKAVSTRCTLFRNNTGVGWQGVGKPVVIRQPRMVKLEAGDVVLRKGRRINFGLFKGSSDLIGITPMKVELHHVGCVIGVFTSPEIKTDNGRPSEAQLIWNKNINEMGGIAGVVRSVEDMEELLDKFKHK